MLKGRGHAYLTLILPLWALHEEQIVAGEVNKWSIRGRRRLVSNASDVIELIVRTATPVKPRM
jgi:hypothetical protein